MVDGRKSNRVSIRSFDSSFVLIVFRGKGEGKKKNQNEKRSLSNHNGSLCSRFGSKTKQKNDCDTFVKVAGPNPCQRVITTTLHSPPS